MLTKEDILCAALFSVSFFIVFFFISVKRNMPLGIQGDQLNMTVFFCYLDKVSCLVYTYTVALTGQVTFFKVLEKHDVV